ncbi:hypothetical protein CSR02_02965 [Acetobacter pomorum]|uniref:DUF2213 domain-containing protein n=1 Tax=Acetobacter pomorum TaxID=65959 RepID=A0A2G4RES7_9PROT|nr:DUF2213 domain-containing protein [Acetobacter pomorum]PHY95047.1 hypothetical protein CSR02_02965 [Acetobacter pomorum]GBR51210.1 phage-like protein [Acetobacter pomorum DSM 11825]
MLFPSMAFDQSVRVKSPEGHLRITQCVLSSACVCPYYGREIPGWRELGLEPETIYQLYRDPTALAQAADTMRGKPVLFTHQPVSAGDHPAEITVGSVTDARFEDPDLVGSFTVWTQDAIDAIESGELKAVSAGYAYKAIPQGGVLNGQPYSLTMVDIVFNHLALVATPRVPHAIIGDALPKDIKMANTDYLKDKRVQNMLEERVSQLQNGLDGSAHDANWLMRLDAILREDVPSKNTAMDSLARQRFAEWQTREKTSFRDQFPMLARIKVLG